MDTITENVIITNQVPLVLQQKIISEAYTNVAVLVDENTHEHCYNVIKAHLPEHTLIQIKSGEIHKNLESCKAIWHVLTQQSFDRKGVLINLGGGVIGDMGGFCARTYKRGIAFINIPTTLLAQVDASVGGKLGIDFDHFKNHIGLFSEPDQVIIDPIFLKTLPERQLRSGYAEVIKHNLIADAEGWETIKKNSFPATDWMDTLRHSVTLKADVVLKDPTEKGLRKTLNFGHTIGHAVESYLLRHDRSVLHGEAVAAGMITEAYISYNRQFIDNDSLKEIVDYIDLIFERIKLNENDILEISNYAIQDKKNKGNRIMAALLKEVGSAQWDTEISKDEIQQSLQYYTLQT
ncbi:3-dehydroquinate synthase [Fulvivirga sp. M361]|uniref:3-dehydroquinate synthase n=1 Tax=Fulvivirga sp. M361 TaxID=2594266 RepID=UPI00351AE93E